MKQITLFCDGGCDPNPGYGAFAALLQFTSDDGRTHERLVSGTEAESTNQRAEIQAALVGVRSLTQPCEIRVYSDSQYIIQTMMGKWSKKTNLDLWQQLTAAVADGSHKVEWTWVKGHNGNAGNERCHAEVERLLRVHQASDLVNGGERLSDDDWIKQTIADHKRRRIEAGLE